MKDAMDRSDGSGNSQDGGNHEATRSESESDATERMRRAIAAVAAHDGSTDELQTAARALVADLRRHDAPPEKMLLKIKEILSSAGLRSACPNEDGEPPDREAAVYRDVIVWSIRAYYDGSGDESG